MDLISAPFAIFSATHLWLLRRCEIANFPLSRRVLLALGVFPLRRHYYEPLFHPADLIRPLNSPRRLPGIDFNEAGHLALISRFRFADEIRGKFMTAQPPRFWGRELTPDNPAFGRGDIDYYYSLVRLLKPSRVVEIGAGYSTMVALCAVEENRREIPEHACALVAVEPYPWFQDDRIEIIRERVERASPAVFAALGAGDILFIDSSHMIRPQGDVLCEILEILPSLASGVVVHLHDVFTPRDYPDGWITTQHIFWNEQYLVEAFLSCNAHFEIIGALNWLQLHHRGLLEQHCPTLAGKPEVRPHSLWLRKK